MTFQENGEYCIIWTPCILLFYIALNNFLRVIISGALRWALSDAVMGIWRGEYKILVSIPKEKVL